MKKRWLITVSLLGLVGFLCVLALRKPPRPEKVISQEMIARLPIGLARAEVEELFGIPGMPDSVRPPICAFENAKYALKWTDADAFIRVHFDSDDLVCAVGTNIGLPPPTFTERIRDWFANFIP